MPEEQEWIDSTVDLPIEHSVCEVIEQGTIWKDRLIRYGNRWLAEKDAGTANLYHSEIVPCLWRYVGGEPLSPNQVQRRGL